MLAASVIQDQVALATQVLEAVSTLALAVERIPARVVGLTPDLVVGRIPAQAVGHTPDLAAGVIPALVGGQRTSGIARHLIANRKVSAIRRDLNV